jgi:hypothetical protein
MAAKSQCLASAARACWARAAGRVAIVTLVCFCFAATAAAQEPPVHYLHQGIMPPGAIGSLRLQRGGPVSGYFQPVEIRAPKGTLVSLAEGGAFAQPQATPAVAGMLIGQVYRLRVTNVPLQPGREAFPTLEVIDRLYAPPGQQARFPIVVEMTDEDLVLALDGKFVTRVIYLEDPQASLPVAEQNHQQIWFDVGPKADPLAVADTLGRPVAILRMGARLPDDSGRPDPDFLFGCPPFVSYTTPTGEILPPSGGNRSASTNNKPIAVSGVPSALLR